MVIMMQDVTKIKFALIIICVGFIVGCIYGHFVASDLDFAWGWIVGYFTFTAVVLIGFSIGGLKEWIVKRQLKKLSKKPKTLKK